jgi:HEAT repeat protein
MIALKRAVAIVVVNVVVGLLGVSLAAAQEMSVEESYLQESVENMIIREQSQAMGRDTKLVALEYINQAISHGNTSEDVRNALEYLALEGLTNQTRENGRLINNFPDVRARAAIYLGEIGTPEAKDTLLKVMLAEMEPMVLTEAVKSLAKIGINDNEETASTISWVVARFDVLNPDNLLALASLEALETLAKKNGGLKDPATLRTIMRIANGRYIKPVQDRAQQLIYDLRQYKTK